VKISTSEDAAGDADLDEERIRRLASEAPHTVGQRGAGTPILREAREVVEVLAFLKSTPVPRGRAGDAH
jgi:hypothetical protein